jgi:hypothetical protein
VKQQISSRFILWERPAAYPFFDLILRDTDPGPVFDLSVDLHDYNGSVYITQDHIIEMARSIGMATVGDVAEMNAHITSLETQISKLPTAQEELKNGLASLVSKFHSDLLNDDPVLPVVVPEPEPADPVAPYTERETVGPFSL